MLVLYLLVLDTTTRLVLIVSSVHVAEHDYQTYIYIHTLRTTNSSFNRSLG